MLCASDSPSGLSVLICYKKAKKMKSLKLRSKCGVILMTRKVNKSAALKVSALKAVSLAATLPAA